MVSLKDHFLHVLFRLGADGELVVLCDQALQALEAPKKNPFLLDNQLLREKGIVYSVLIFALGGQDNLPSEESLAAVVQGFQRTVAKTEEAAVQLALVTLLAFLFQVQRQLCGDDGLDIVGLGQRAVMMVLI